MFPYQCSEDIFRELRAVSRGGPVDYYGITYDKIDREKALLACPDLDHPGTPRLTRAAVPPRRRQARSTRWVPPAAEDSTTNTR